MSVRTTIHLDDDEPASFGGTSASSYGRIYDEQDLSQLEAEQSNKRKKKRTFVLCLLIGFLIAAGIAVAFLFLRNPKSDGVFNTAMVNVTQGTLRGARIESTDVFRFGSVPFAAPPVNQLRWLKPQPLAPWPNVRDATGVSPMCVQNDNDGKMVGQEDCLYLNVWTKQIVNETGGIDHGNVPVMVFIHGGSSLEGGSSLPEYDHSNLVNDKNIVAVTINYRVNLFGYLALDVLSENSLNYTGLNKSGNYGLLDNIAALTWIKSNIASFGGDPKRVTVYGQSTGGTNVMSLLISPLARNTFDAALSLSGSPVLKGTLAEASSQNFPFLTKSQCNKATKQETRDCIYALSPQAVLDAIPDRWTCSFDYGVPNASWPDAALIVVDEYVIPDELNAALAAGDAAPVALVYSHMAQENDVDPISRVPGLNQMQFSAWLNDYLLELGWNATQANAIVALYPIISYNGDSQLTYETLVTDITACGGRTNLVHASIKAKTPIFHLFNRYTPSTPIEVGHDWTEKFAGHEWDLYLLLQNFPNKYDVSDVDRAHSNMLRNFFVDQLATSLTITDTSTWPPFNIAQLSGKPNSTYTLELKSNQDQPVATKDFNKGLCGMLNDLGFGSAGWAN